MKLRYKILNGFLAILAIAIVALAIVLSHTKPCEPGSELAADATTMKAVVYRCYGPPEVLSYEDVEKPVPADNQVLVKVHAAAVNPLDYHYMRGLPYIMRLSSGIGAPEDIRMGRDYAGIVEAVGKDVTKFKPGDAVFGGAGGAFAEYIVGRQDGSIAHKPDNVTFEQAGSVGVAAITALQALRDKGGVGEGMKVLINGASGGVGTFAVQIAKAYGAEVHGVCSTRNVEMVKSLGADRVFDYKKEDYTQSGEQYDIIVDNVGNHSILANTGVMKPDGRFVMVGAQKGPWIAPLLRPLNGMILSPFVDQDIQSILAVLRQEDMEELATLMADGKVTPVIDQTFTLDKTADAIAYSESGRARGKIIVTVE
jgi:NADPH:quinone reductase-like Zn-dependent oxidoreductase